jgi:UDP-N-acetyl-D-galactosamine dehydrogenase
MTSHELGVDRASARNHHTRSERICVVGLGYVGLPLAVRFSERGHDVLGFDVDETHVETLENGVDTNGDLGDDTIADSDVTFTTDAPAFGHADYVFVTVPTPLDEDRRPDLQALVAAGETVGEAMEPGTTVVLESTVYPGATREAFVPALERGGLACGDGFDVAYSPERASPGEAAHDLTDTIKVVGADRPEVREDVADLYETVVDVGVHEAPSIEVAEAAKVVENAQRDVNIALMNELAVAFDRLDVETSAVLEAAATKWNFHEYRPGLVGGHCIPVDPHYLIRKAEREGFTPELLQAGREVNESMPDHVADIVVRGLNDCGKVLRDSSVLVLGLSYKPNVGDVRTSKVREVGETLSEYGIDLAGYDPHVPTSTARETFGFEVLSDLSTEGFDAVLLATPHDEFLRLNLDVLAAQLADDPLLVDVDGALSADEPTDHGFTYRQL